VLAALHADPGQRPDSARSFFALLRDAVVDKRVPAQTGSMPAQVLASVPRDVALQQTMASGVAVAPGAMAAAAAATGMMQAVPAPGPSSGVRSAWLVGARIPPSRLGHQEDRRFLSELAQRGRAFVFGGQFWFALQATEGGEEARTQAEAMMAALSGRFGALVKARWCPVGEDFQLTAMALSGATPLPPVLSDLLQQLRAG
jgi:hypothetical protein